MILASQSPRRRELLRDAGFAFTCMPASINEDIPAGADPVRTVADLARRKAQTISANQPDEVIIGSDTVVVLGARILGKPRDDTDAARMLAELSGKTHRVCTGVSICQNSIEVASFVSTTSVTFWDLTPQEIAAYVATSEPRDKAGAYGIQGKGRLLVKKISGDYYTVVGLPIVQLARELARLGIYPTTR